MPKQCRRRLLFVCLDGSDSTRQTIKFQLDDCVDSAAAILSEGIEDMLPRTLVTRPLLPALKPVLVMLALPAVRPNRHAETFAQLLRSELARPKAMPKAFTG